MIMIKVMNANDGVSGNYDAPLKYHNIIYVCV